VRGTSDEPPDPPLFDRPEEPPVTTGATVTGTVPWTDPRDQIEVVVMLADGRLAPRRFTTLAEAHAWARPEEGEQVLEQNLVCSCDR
jgi:hypothetical protein